MPDTTVTKSQILIVDDEKEHAQVMCDALARLGHKCDLVHDLADARSRMERKAYDVLVTDLMMDGRCDGLEVLRQSKRLDPAPRCSWSPPTPTSRPASRPSTKAPTTTSKSPSTSSTSAPRSTAPPRKPRSASRTRCCKIA